MCPSSIFGLVMPFPACPHRNHLLFPLIPLRPSPAEPQSLRSPQMPPSGFHTLSLAGLENITDAGAAALLRGPAASKSLTSVDFSKCPNLTEAAMALTSKTRLRSLGAGTKGSDV